MCIYLNMYVCPYESVDIHAHKQILTICSAYISPLSLLYGLPIFA